MNRQTNGERPDSSEYEELKARQEALRKQMAELRRVLIGDREFAEVETQQDVWSQMVELTAEVNDHSKELAATDNDSRSNGMSEQGRLNKIRRFLVRAAQDANEPDYGVDYQRIHSLFEGEISESWASQLMKKAAGDFPKDANKPKRGFYYKKRRRHNNEIHVLLPKIEDRSFLRIKNSSEEDPP